MKRKRRGGRRICLLVLYGHSRYIIFKSKFKYNYFVVAGDEEEAGRATIAGDEEEAGQVRQHNEAEAGSCELSSLETKRRQVELGNVMSERQIAESYRHWRRRGARQAVQVTQRDGGRDRQLLAAVTREENEARWGAGAGDEEEAGRGGQHDGGEPEVAATGRGRVANRIRVPTL